MSGVWVQPDLRDRVVDFVRERAEQTELPASRLVGWIGIGASKFFDWKRRYGQVNEPNAWVPRDHWLEDWEKQAIIDFYPSHPDEGYRRVTDLMMDADIVAASPSSVYRVLSQAGALRRREAKPSKKGKGFVPPPSAHAHWHIDVSTLKLSGTFYYLCSILDGYSRSIDHYEIREQMTEQDVEIIPATARRAGCGRWKPFPRPGHASSRTMVRSLWRRILRLSFESRAWIMCGLRRTIRRATVNWSAGTRL